MKLFALFRGDDCGMLCEAKHEGRALTSVGGTSRKDSNIE